MHSYIDTVCYFHIITNTAILLELNSIIESGPLQTVAMSLYQDNTKYKMICNYHYRLTIIINEYTHSS